MKMKLTTLMFSLLLAVGWTSSVSAQALPQGGYAERLGLDGITATQIVKDIVKTQKKATSFQILPMSTEENTQESTPMMAPRRVTGVSSAVKNKAYYQQFKYNWTDDETGETHTNVDPTEPATNAYQIYELLRFVYGNPNFPGPSYSAYKPDYNREDPVTYNAVSGGWDITAGSGGAAMITHDITITASSFYASITSIAVYDMNGNVLTSWNAQSAIDNGEYTSYTASDGTRYRFTLPGWTCSANFGIFNVGDENNVIYSGYFATDATTPGTITIPYSLLNGQTQVRVVINANHDYEEGDEGSATQTLTVNGEAMELTSTLADYTWTPTVAEQPEQGAFVQGTVVPPYEDGYTVLVVALNNDIQIEPEPKPHLATNYTQKSEIIAYFKQNVEYVKLLTDGLRIGSEEDHTSGTVFNCDGRYNKFFFLGKGQARKKSQRIIDRINSGWYTYDNTYGYITYQDYFCESVPFEEMFEQFSPTGGDEGDQITDFFSKMREGNVYNVEHDCASVIQLGHQFSLSGNDGTDYYPFSGLNFFCPDYRLLFWDTTRVYNGRTYTIDGRDMNAYESVNATTGVRGDAFVSANTNFSYWSAYFAQYNQDYAPKVGIYRITLDATATQTGTTHDPNNLNFDVTLTWVSSLDQMSGHKVPQIYTVYLVDENGDRTLLEPESVKFYDINGNELTGDYSNNPFVVTQVVYKVPQDEHSYTLEYQVDGVAQQGPEFHATSNKASVVIPGWEDFVGLKLDHHESDFDPNFEGKRVNFYRNFLAMVNEDIYNGLTVSKITGYNETDPSTPLEKMDKFNLYRFLYNAQGQPTTETKVATITFDQASADQVHFNVAYENQEVENYTLQYKENNQTYTITDAYSHAKMDIPTEGWVRVKGNGDIVIWPNRYSVNIKSITVKNGSSTITSWNASSANVATQSPNLPTTPYKWGVSPGSKLLPYTTSPSNEKVCYMEGGGYLYIPGVLNTYPNATVVIEAFGEAGNVNRISVNDATQDINATVGGTSYTWPTGSNPLSPNAAPRRAAVEKSSSLVFTAKCNGSGTADDGAVWTVTSDAAESDFDDTKGIHYGTSSAAVSYIQLATDQIPGTITKIVVEASRASRGTGFVSTTVGGNAFGGNAQTLTTSNAAYTFEGSASGPVVVRIFKNSSANRALYCKSITVYYEVEGEDTPTEGGLLRLHVLFADQFKEEIQEDNSHPDAYGYILRYEPESGNNKESGKVRVNIQKTDCDVMGYYTLGQIDRDTNRGLTMDVLTADVEYDLTNTNELLNYYYLQGAANRDPQRDGDYLSQLYRQEDFTYREMLEGSPEFDHVVNSGEHHYFNSTDEPIIGQYNDGSKYVSYAPSVSTWGIQRRYYELDGKENTYGGPIWKTAVGKAQMGLNPDDPDAKEYKPIVEFQQGWNTSWKDANGVGSNLYMLDNINALGYLPPKTLTKVEFEPYMFRVFVESDNGKLRPYKFVKDNNGNDVITAGEGSTNGPICVWSGYIKRDNDGKIINDPENGVIVDSIGTYGPYTYTKNKVDRTGGSDADPLGEWDKDENNAIFGALDDLLITGFDADGKPILRTNPIPEEDLRIFVRFYFSVKGEAADHTIWTRSEGSRSGNGAESDGSAAGSIATAVKEVAYHGEVVGQTYYNIQGMESDQPFDGVNIVVTRYSDGATSISKVIR